MTRPSSGLCRHTTSTTTSGKRWLPSDAALQAQFGPQHQITSSEACPGVCRDNKHQGWQQLAGLFLSITGAEALYADLGHFNKTAIRVRPAPGLAESLQDAGGLCCC